MRSTSSEFGMEELSPKQRANNLEVEAAYAKFRRSRQVKATKRKAKKEKEQAESDKSPEDDQEFEIRLAKHREELDRHIPLEDRELSLKLNQNGMPTNSHLNNERDKDVFDVRQNSPSSALILHDKLASPMKEENRNGGKPNETNLKVLEPVPIRVHKFEDLKLASVGTRSAPSLHTGA